MAQNKSGLRFHFNVWIEGEEKPLDIVTGPADVVFWEKASGKAFGDGVSIQMMMWLAWRAGRRKQLIDEKKFETWVDTVVDFDNVEDEDGEEPSPIQPADSEL
jgi:hypothetical protein